MKTILIGLVLAFGACGARVAEVKTVDGVGAANGDDMQSSTSSSVHIDEREWTVEHPVVVGSEPEIQVLSSANSKKPLSAKTNGLFILDADADDDSAKEDSLTRPLPPSHKARRWGLSIGLIALFGISIFLWIYRHHLPIRLPNIPHVHFGLPTITSSTFTLPYASPKKNQFRPAPNSLLEWTEDEDPSNPSPGPSQSRSRSRSVLSSSSWRSKIPVFGRRGASVSNGPGSRSRTRLGGLFLGELDSDNIEEGYEEVGLLPNPNPYPSERSRLANYGSV